MIHQITAYTVYKIANGNVFIKSETEFGRAKVTKQASKYVRANTTAPF